jgi:hypothetical protein
MVEGMPVAAKRKREYTQHDRVVRYVHVQPLWRP